MIFLAPEFKYGTPCSLMGKTPARTEPTNAPALETIKKPDKKSDRAFIFAF